jgi:16S rRNA (adenine1518-N6/adenine1519-N6)-dimethyltransferase
LKKRFGQHFLTDRSILRRMFAFAGISPADTVVEIGPGAGALTRELAGVARKVTAIEIDPDLIPRLQADMPSNVDIVEGDALEVEVPAGPFHLVGNLPYNVATPLLRRAIDYRDRILDVTVMVQKEVAERIRATPGSEHYGPLSGLIQYYAIPQWGFTVPPGAFTPRPKVDSAVIRLTWRDGVQTDLDFTNFVHRAFSARRKKLINNLVQIFPAFSRDTIAAALVDAHVSEGARPEELSVNKFLDVYNRLRWIKHSK